MTEPDTVVPPHVTFVMMRLGARTRAGPAFGHPTAGVLTGPYSETMFTAIDHVGIAVPDLDAAIAWYRDHFDMHVVHEEVNEEQGVREAMLAVGDSGSCVQLLAPLTPESTIAAFLDRRGPGIQQMAYRVEDIEKVSATLRERGVRLLYDAPRRGTAGSRVNFVHPKDAGGVLVELVEPADGGHS
jgi:methylmalonyl-CoA/ethylmalonyl-CoA epimerase